MSALRQAVRGFKNIWHNADDDEYAEDYDTNESPASEDYPAEKYSTEKYSTEKYASYSNSQDTNGSGGSGSTPSSSRRLRPVAMPMRAREKNIYTLKPKSQDEASIAADYLKGGSAVVLNLETVDHTNATRIIDFMSGVCYGLEGQGHAMKLGDTIFLFTPCEFEISSDEVDYGENRDFYFKELTESTSSSDDSSGSVSTYSSTASPTSSSSERRSWER